MLYLDDAENPSDEIISFDHTHTMEQAVKTPSQIGFMSRNLEHEQ
jgi:hypothetical protein